MKILQHSEGSKIQGNCYIFDDTVTSGSIDTVLYRVGELLAPCDTLWGASTLAYFTKLPTTFDYQMNGIFVEPVTETQSKIYIKIKNNSYTDTIDYTVTLRYKTQVISETITERAYQGSEIKYLFNQLLDLTEQDLDSLTVTIDLDDDYPFNNSQSEKINSYRGFNALAFDGIDDVVVVPDNDSLDFTNNYTLEAWVKINELKFSGIISKYQQAGANGFMLRLKSLAPYNQFEFDEMVGGPELETGKWYHVAAVKSDTGRALIVDGIPYALSGTPINVQANTNELRIGEDFHLNNNRYFKGQIDEVRIWNVARDLQQVNNNKDSLANSDTLGLVCRYTFNQGKNRYDNTLIYKLLESSSNRLHGDLSGFSLHNGDSVSNFVASEFEVKYCANPGGSINGKIYQVVRDGYNADTVKAVPVAGRYFVSWSDGSTNELRLDTNIRADISVIANFASYIYTLSYSSGTYGYLSGDSLQTVAYGDKGSDVEAVPVNGYHFENWSDGSTDNPRIDSNITADITVTANFAINTFTLNYIAGTNGSVSGASSQVVDYGSDGTPVEAIPSPGCHFINWSDGRTDNPRTDTNVTANITVTANFALDGVITLSYFAGPNGSISGVTPQTLSMGEDGTPVEAIPDSGFYFAGWSDSHMENPRADSNVTSDITVTANFSPITSILGTAKFNDVRIYPNPASTIIHIETSWDNYHSMTLMNLTGQTLIQKTHNINGPVDISNLPKGIYFVVLKGDSSKVIKKVVLF